MSNEEFPDRQPCQGRRAPLSLAALGSAEQVERLAIPEGAHHTAAVRAQKSESNELGFLVLDSTPPIDSAARLRRFLELVQEQRFFSPNGTWGTSDRLRFFLDRLFDGIDVEGKRCLDVGAGNGVFSIALGLRGASEVCALEPEAAGSNSAMSERFLRMIGQVGVTNVRLERKTLQEALPGLRPFDLVLLHNCINHFDEPSCIVLHRDQAAQNAYLETFRDLYRVTKDNGIVIITDCTRHNFFGMLGLRSPLAPSIEWEKHQPPSVWGRLAERVGFQRERVEWTTPGHLGSLGHRLLSNSVASFFLLGHFILVLRKVHKKVN
jgi:SAM-dependent methyltransferase